MRIEEGKVYRIDISRSPYNEPYGGFPEYETYDGREITIFDIQEEQEYGFFYDSWYFSKDLLVEVKEKRVSRVLKEDTRIYTDFKEGDLVRIRTIEDLRQHFYSNEKYVFTEPIRFPLFDEELVELSGETAIVSRIDRDFDIIKLELEQRKDRLRFIEVSTEEIEIVEKGYVKRMEEEAKERRFQTNIDVDTDEVTQEMLKKVDVDKFKKILVGSLRVKGTALLGVDKLLKDWARAKREIYLALGRNLVIRKPIEYLMEDKDVKEKQIALASKFPRVFSYY